MLPVVVIGVLFSLYASVGMSYASGASPTGMIVPLYSYPDSNWSTLVKEKTDHPSVPIVAIINPDSGPGTQDTNYVYGVKKLQSAGIKVIGYIYTANVGYGTITKYIDEYKDWYGLDGIFFDQMSYAKGNETFYASLTNYSKSVGMNFTVGNPGTDTLPSYVGTVDNMVLYDNPSLPAPSKFLGWHKNFTKSNFSFVAYNVQNVNKTYVDSITRLVQYIYATNYTLPNPFHVLPPYVDDVMQMLGAQNMANNTVPVLVDAYDDKGKHLAGLWTVVKSGNATSSGFTPFSFDAIRGNNYTVTVSNFGNYTFDHWNDGTRGNAKAITAGENMTLYAYYVASVAAANHTANIVPANHTANNATANKTSSLVPKPAAVPSCNCTSTPAVSNTGTISATLSYVTGDRAYGYGVSVKIYQDTDQSVYRNIDTLPSNPFDVNSLPLGHTYKFVVYANGMQADVEYLLLERTGQKLALHLPPPGGIRPNVFYNDGVTPVQNAILYVLDQKNNTWGTDYTDIRGQTLRFWLEPTKVNDDHYVMDIKIGQHLSYSYWPVFLYPGTSRDISIVTPWPPIVDSLITVKAYDGQSRLLSAKNSSFVVDLADANGNAVSESKINYHGEANFSNLKVGDYVLSLVGANGTKWAESKITIDGTKTVFNIFANSTPLGNSGTAK